MFTKKTRTLIGASVGIILLLFCTSHTTPGQSLSDRTPQAATFTTTRDLDPELLRLAQNFETLSPEEFRNWLLVQQPDRTRADQEQQARSLASLSQSKNRRMIQDGDQVYRLSERMGPLLRLFRRDGVARFI